MTFATLDHPRIADGTFTDKQQSAAEVFLAVEDSLHTVTPTVKQSNAIAFMAEELDIEHVFLSRSTGGCVVATYLNKDLDDYLYAAVITEDGNVIEASAQTFRYMQSRDWRNITGHNALGEDTAAGAPETAASFAVRPNTAQSRVITSMTNERHFETSIAKDPTRPGHIRVLAVARHSSGPNTILSALVNPAGQMLEAASFTENDDEELQWLPRPNREIIRIISAKN